MKRFLAILLIFAMTISVISCGVDNSDNENNDIKQTDPDNVLDSVSPDSPSSESVGYPSDNGDVDLSPKDEYSEAYLETRITLKPSEVYEWYFDFDANSQYDFTVSDNNVVVILGNFTRIVDNSTKLYFVVQALDVEAYTSITVTFAGKTRVLHIYVEKANDEQDQPQTDTPEIPIEPGQETFPPEIPPIVSDDPEVTSEFLESVAHLSAYEVYVWEMFFVESGNTDISVETEGVVHVLGSGWISENESAAKFIVTLQTEDITSYTKITAKAGNQTRVLHLHVAGTDNIEPPQPDENYLNVDMFGADTNLTYGENPTRILIHAILPGDATLQIDNSNEEVLDVRYEYYPNVDVNGLVASIEIFVKPIGVGVGTVTISYPEYPAASTSITFTSVKEHFVYLGEGELSKSITVDKTDAEVYRDDTAVTYTVETSLDVDKLEFIHLSNDYYLPISTFNELINVDKDWIIELDKLTIDETMLSEELVYNASKKTYYSATRKEENGKLIWTVVWDLGNTAVQFVKINAVDTESEQTHESYVKLNITYPEFDVSEGLRVVINRWVELNMTEPLIFTVDTDTLTDYQKYLYFDQNVPYMLFADECEILMNSVTAKETLATYDYMRVDNLDDNMLYDYRFDNNVIYRNTFVSGLMRYSMVACMLGNNRYGHSFMQLEGKQILAYDADKPIFFFHYEIYDETRALIAYENGYEIDEEKFPYAHDMLEKGSAIIDEIITEGMTDFEKEKAIYDWMIENFYKGVRVPPEMGDPQNPNPEWLACVKSAYGILNQYEADCMGWSGAFYLLCNMAGVPCNTFSCAGGGGGADESYDNSDHRINIIRLDGEYYFVEVYWFFQTNDPNDGNYRYMNMTTEMAAENYTWPGSKWYGPADCNYTTYLVDEHTGELLNK